MNNTTGNFVINIVEEELQGLSEKDQILYVLGKVFKKYFKQVAEPGPKDAQSAQTDTDTEGYFDYDTLYENYLLLTKHRNELQNAYDVLRENFKYEMNTRIQAETAYSDLEETLTEKNEIISNLQFDLSQVELAYKDAMQSLQVSQEENKKLEVLEKQLDSTKAELLTIKDNYAQLADMHRTTLDTLTEVEHRRNEALRNYNTLKEENEKLYDAYQALQEEYNATLKVRDTAIRRMLHMKDALQKIVNDPYYTDLLDD